jgi:hypothetical protein
MAEVKATAAERRAQWAAAAKAERAARKGPGEKRLAWLNRPGIKARMSDEAWATQVAACQVALAPAAQPAAAETAEERKRRLARDAKRRQRATAKARR